jgi:hypothetical protein
MKWAVIVLGLAFVATPITITTEAQAVQKSSTGVACNSTGTARKDGKDAATGEKLNCLWDTCTYCGTTNGTIDCSKQITEYSNPTDCKPAAKAGIFGNRQSIFRNGTLQLQMTDDSKPTPNTNGGDLNGGMEQKQP